MRVLLIDFYDSFTYNIQHYFVNLGCEVDVILDDKVDLALLHDYDCVVLSPGPGLPSEKNLSEQPEWIPNKKEISVLRVAILSLLKNLHSGKTLPNSVA